MEWRRYLAAMWIIFGELLRAGYSTELGEADSSLIESTRGLIRDVARGRAYYADDAHALCAAWDRQRAHEGEVSLGLSTVWLIAHCLAGEVDGEMSEYEATGWLGNAVTELWRTPEDKMRHEYPIYRPDEEIDDSSPQGKFLKLLQRISESVASYSGDLDPAQMLEEILPE